jgi:hypothetical protein
MGGAAIPWRLADTPSVTPSAKTLMGI